MERFFDLRSFEHKDLFENCKHPWDALKNIKKYLESRELGMILGEISPQAYLINPESISIGKGTKVEPGAYIEGPCIIGENCEIRHGAYIRPGVITGNSCVIGHATEVKHSIFLNGAKAAHFNYVGDSILGDGVNLGAGAKLANFRLDGKEVIIYLNNERIASGLKKLGAIIGDRANLGCNCVTNPGTIIGKLASCFPCTSIKGHIL